MEDWSFKIGFKAPWEDPKTLKKDDPYNKLYGMTFIHESEEVQNQGMKTTFFARRVWAFMSFLYGVITPLDYCFGLCESYILRTAVERRFGRRRASVASFYACHHICS